MAIEVRIPTILRTFTGGAKSVEGSGDTLDALLADLDSHHPGLRGRLVDDGGLRRFVNVYLNDEDVRFLGGLLTSVKDGDTVTVLPASAKLTTQAAVTRQAKSQMSRVVSELKRLNTTAPTSPHQILVGAGTSGSAEIAAFFPKRLNINVGDTVTFVDNDPTDVHTVTFGSEEYTSAIENSVFEYAGHSLVFNPLSALPSEPPESPSPVPYDGTNHGDGYINSGLLYPPQTPEQLHEFAVTFTKPGTYRLECVIHSNMDATIVVP